MKNYHLDFGEITEAIITDLRASNIMVDAETKRTYREAAEEPAVFRRIKELAKEYLWYKLMETYQSIPATMGSLFEHLAYTLQYMPDSSAPPELAVEDLLLALTSAEQLFNSYLEYFPINPWAMVDVNFEHNVATVTFGKDLRVYLYEQEHGGSRYKGDPVQLVREHEVLVDASLSIVARFPK